MSASYLKPISKILKAINPIVVIDCHPNHEFEHNSFLPFIILGKEKIGD